MAPQQIAIIWIQTSDIFLEHGDELILTADLDQNRRRIRDGKILFFPHHRAIFLIEGDDRCAWPSDRNDDGVLINERTGAETFIRQRRFELQTAYGQALLWSKGFAAEETQAAFDRARELAGPTPDAASLFSARYEQFTRGFIGGDMTLARSVAEDFLRDAEDGGYAMEAAVGRRIVGSVCLIQGELREARTHLERVLADFVPDRDADARCVDP